MDESMDPQQPVPARVRGALVRTEDLESVPAAEHVARFEAVHGALTDALSTIEE